MCSESAIFGPSTDVTIHVFRNREMHSAAGRGRPDQLSETGVVHDSRDGIWLLRSSVLVRCLFLIRARHQFFVDKSLNLSMAKSSQGIFFYIIESSICRLHEVGRRGGHDEEWKIMTRNHPTVLAKLMV